MTTMGEKYEALEQLTLQLDDAGDFELSDKFRDLMDVIWYSRLKEGERTRLNARGEVLRKESQPLHDLTILRLNILVPPPQLAPTFAGHDQIEVMGALL